VAIVIKTPEEIDKIAASGRILARCHRLLRAKARPGVTTEALDEAAERFIRSQGATPAFKGYHGFPGSICASPNSMVVHGIPGRYELRRGDVLSIDIGVDLDGWISDAAVTMAIGKVTDVAHGLLASTRASLFDGIEQCVAGNRLGDVSAAIQRRVEADGYSIIRSLVGHGVGREMHEDPQIPNFGAPATGPLLEEGMVLAIEPMVNAGGPDVRLGADNWAVYAQDGSLTAHFEHTVAITAAGPRILTPWHVLSSSVGAWPTPGPGADSLHTEGSDEGPSIGQAHV
jgi:methionyl aminopeptidase